jgi:hypothetical protein
MPARMSWPWSTTTVRTGRRLVVLRYLERDGCSAYVHNLGWVRPNNAHAITPAHVAPGRPVPHGPPRSPVSPTCRAGNFHLPPLRRPTGYPCLRRSVFFPGRRPIEIAHRDPTIGTLALTPSTGCVCMPAVGWYGPRRHAWC